MLSFFKVILSILNFVNTNQQFFDILLNKLHASTSYLKCDTGPLVNKQVPGIGSERPSLIYDHISV